MKAKTPPVELRVRVFEALPSALMVTSYPARRSAEVGFVGFVPIGPVVATRPGGSAPS